MSKLPYLPLFTEDFIGATTHLSAGETGAYLMLLLSAWRSPGCRLPNDPARLRRMSRVDTRSWARVWPVVRTFFVVKVEGGKEWLIQPRLSAEYAKATAKSRRGSAGAAGRWAEPALPLEDDTKGPATVASEGTHENGSKSLKSLDRAYAPAMPVHSSESIKKKKGGEGASAWPPDAYERFIAAYPCKDHQGGWRGAKLAFETAALKLAGKMPFTDLLAKVEVYKTSCADSRWMKASNWLNEERWLDDPAANDPPPQRTTVQTPQRGGGMARMLAEAAAELAAERTPHHEQQGFGGAAAGNARGKRAQTIEHEPAPAARRGGQQARG